MTFLCKINTFVDETHAYLALEPSFYTNLPETRVVSSWLKSILPFLFHIKLLFELSILFSFSVKLTFECPFLDLLQRCPLIGALVKFFRFIELALVPALNLTLIVVTFIDITSLIGLHLDEAANILAALDLLAIIPALLQALAAHL